MISGQTARSLTVSTSIANTGPLQAGVYRFIASVAVSVAVGRATPTPALTTSNGLPIAANASADIYIPADQTFYAIAGGAGSVLYIRIGE